MVKVKATLLYRSYDKKCPPLESLVRSVTRRVASSDKGFAEPRNFDLQPAKGEDSRPVWKGTVDVCEETGSWLRTFGRLRFDSGKVWLWLEVS